MTTRKNVKHYWGGATHKRLIRQYTEGCIATYTCVHTRTYMYMKNHHSNDYREGFRPNKNNYSSNIAVKASTLVHFVSKFSTILLFFTLFCKLQE